MDDIKSISDACKELTDKKNLQLYCKVNLFGTSYEWINPKNVDKEELKKYVKVPDRIIRKEVSTQNSTLKNREINPKYEKASFVTNIFLAVKHGCVGLLLKNKEAFEKSIADKANQKLEDEINNKIYNSLSKKQKAILSNIQGVYDGKSKSENMDIDQLTEEFNFILMLFNDDLKNRLSINYRKLFPRLILEIACRNNEDNPLKDNPRIATNIFSEAANAKKLDLLNDIIKPVLDAFKLDLGSDIEEFLSQGP